MFVRRLEQFYDVTNCLLISRRMYSIMGKNISKVYDTSTVAAVEEKRYRIDRLRVIVGGLKLIKN